MLFSEKLQLQYLKRLERKRAVSGRVLAFLLLELFTKLLGHTGSSCICHSEFQNLLDKLGSLASSYACSDRLQSANNTRAMDRQSECRDARGIHNYCLQAFEEEKARKAAALERARRRTTAWFLLGSWPSENYFRTGFHAWGSAPGIE